MIAYALISLLRRFFFTLRCLLPRYGVAAVAIAMLFRLRHFDAADATIAAATMLRDIDVAFTRCYMLMMPPQHHICH